VSLRQFPLSFRLATILSPEPAHSRFLSRPRTRPCARAALSASFTAGTTTVSNRLRSSGFPPSPTNASLRAAFAPVRPPQISEFHLSLQNPARPLRSSRARTPARLAPSTRALSSPARAPATGVLTAATHIDPPGAGITAAAGTRLALQCAASSLHSLPAAAHRAPLRLLAASPKGSGQVSRLLPPLDLVAVSQAPSPEPNPDSPLPSPPPQADTLPSS